MYCLRILLVFLAVTCLSLEAWATAPGPYRGNVGVQAEKARKSPEEKKVPALKNSVRRITQFVKKIEGGVLYTEKNQYNLSGVKVMDLTPKRKNTVVKGMPKKTAEMTFLNGQLREVVIRQRQ
jgi:uncharacterized FlaG/YvyC family protein